MSALRASQRAICVQSGLQTSAYLESIPVFPIFDLIRGGELVGVHPRHPRAARPLREPTDERVDRCRGTVGLELDASIGEVPYPAGDAQTSRLVRGAGPKTDTLDATPHGGPHSLQG
jgi:hypothetical protein